VKAPMITLIGSALWAAAFIMSAVVFRRQPIGGWIEGILLVGWIVFISCRNLLGGGRVQ
jgi:hypothetical protein